MAVDDNGPPSTPPRLSGTKRALRDAVGPAGDVADRANAVDALLLFRKDYDDSGGNVISLDPSTTSADAASTPVDAAVIVNKRSLPLPRAPRLPHHCLSLRDKTVCTKISKYFEKTVPFFLWKKKSAHE